MTENGLDDCNFIFYGIATTSGGFGANRESWQNRSEFGASGTLRPFQYESMTSIYMDPVGSAGTYTYYFVARESGNSGLCTVVDKGMTAIFIPS